MVCFERKVISKMVISKSISKTRISKFLASYTVKMLGTEVRNFITHEYELDLDLNLCSRQFFDEYSFMSLNLN
jgi:hypothetical protein